MGGFAAIGLAKNTDNRFRAMGLPFMSSLQVRKTHTINRATIEGHASCHKMSLQKAHSCSTSLIRGSWSCIGNYLNLRPGEYLLC